MSLVHAAWCGCSARARRSEWCRSAKRRSRLAVIGKRGSPVFLAGNACRSTVFVTRAGPHDPAGVLAPHQAPRRARGAREAFLAARAPPRLRDASAEPRRRPARRAAAARSLRYLDHADLHPRRARTAEVSAREAPSPGLTQWPCRRPAMSPRRPPRSCRRRACVHRARVRVRRARRHACRRRRWASTSTTW